MKLVYMENEESGIYFIHTGLQIECRNKYATNKLSVIQQLVWQYKSCQNQNGISNDSIRKILTNKTWKDHEEKVLMLTCLIGKKTLQNHNLAQRPPQPYTKSPSARMSAQQLPVQPLIGITHLIDLCSQ